VNFTTLHTFTLEGLAPHTRGAWQHACHSGRPRWTHGPTFTTHLPTATHLPATVAYTYLATIAWIAPFTHLTHRCHTFPTTLPPAVLGFHTTCVTAPILPAAPHHPFTHRCPFGSWTYLGVGSANPIQLALASGGTLPVGGAEGWLFYAAHAHYTHAHDTALLRYTRIQTVGSIHVYGPICR